MKLEVIAFNIESCVVAQAAGAHRIELCDNRSEGGTTPSLGMIIAARKILSIDLFPIIRPRGGDFFYNDDEFEIMRTDVEACKKAGCDGVVFGMLTQDAMPDEKRCRQLVQLAYPMETTFHRAFDRTSDQSEALEKIIECGFTRILTSGGMPDVMTGKEHLQKIIQQADDRIIIMPGSGVRAENIQLIKEATGAKEFHSSAVKPTETKMKTLNADMNETLSSVISDEEAIKAMLSALHK